MRLLIIIIVGFSIDLFGQGAIKLNQMQAGANDAQIIITKGRNNTQVYRNAVPYLLDSLHLRDSFAVDSSYNGVRVIKRDLVPGSSNLNATTFREWNDWFYIGNYEQPSLMMNDISPTLVEVGDSVTYTISGSTTNPCGYTLSDGEVNFSGYTFGSATTYSTGYTHEPTSYGNTFLIASQDWVMTTSLCEAGTPTSSGESALKTINNRHPMFYGMSATSYTSGSIGYTTFSKVLMLENDATVGFTGTDMYMYYLIPKSWTDYDLSLIQDHNGFNVTPGFTAYDVTVTSGAGIENAWTQNYKLYKSNMITTASGYNYTFYR